MSSLIEIDDDMLELCSGGWGGGYGGDPVWGEDGGLWGTALGCSFAASIGSLIGGDLGFAFGGPVTAWAGSNIGSWAAREACEWVVENGTTDTGGYSLSDLGAP